MELPILESCDGCGACCCHMIVPPFVINPTRNEAEERNVPDDLLSELMPLWEIRFHLEEAPCLWYDAQLQQCQHYELRPQACRDFEINSYNCHACREKHGVT